MPHHHQQRLASPRAASTHFCRWLTSCWSIHGMGTNAGREATCCISPTASPSPIGVDGILCPGVWPRRQNVNKVSTAGICGFEAERSPHLAPPVKAAAETAGRQSLDRRGRRGAVRARYPPPGPQPRDRAERLVELIARRSSRPSGRVATKPTQGSVRRRLASRLHAAPSRRCAAM